MTPDTCPHCGARRDCSNGWSCGSCLDLVTGEFCQSPECARYVRTRISQLKRMASTGAISDAYSRLTRDLHIKRLHVRAPIIWGRLMRFQQSRLREIDRLRGGA